MTVAIACTSGGSASWVQRTALDGVDYVLAFRWNETDAHWLLSIADTRGVSIRDGIYLVADRSLLRGVIDTRAPKGVLIVVDSLAPPIDPGFADLGSRHSLLYLSPADISPTWGQIGHYP